MSDRYDVLIAGAGLVGLALAPALARTGLKVALVDRGAIAAQAESAEDFDTRVYAISPGSASFLSAIGAWQHLASERVTAIEAMHVVGDGGATIDFSAYDLGIRALAWIVEERVLRASLLPLIHAANVSVVPGATFSSLNWSPEEAELALEDGRRMHAKLVIAADGVRSWVRAAAGIDVESKPYGQTAVVANFACERAHHGVARQWFRDDGSILAWLPLPERRISIVWSAPDALAQELQALNPAELADRVAGAGQSALGKLNSITPVATFPLAFLKLPSVVAHRLVLVGDAAHVVHPLAGQGVNLGFGDARALAQIESERGPVDDPGAPILLARFARKRAEPVRAMQTVTDGLTRLFGARSPWLSRLRNTGLTAVDRLPLVKRALAQPALR